MNGSMSYLSFGTTATAAFLSIMVATGAVGTAPLATDEKATAAASPAEKSSGRREPWPVPVEQVPVVKMRPPPGQAPTETAKDVAEPRSKQFPSQTRKIRRQIHNWPDRQVSLARPPSWTAPQRAIASDIPASALAIIRTAATCSSTDTPFDDRLDLVVPPNSGFTLDAI